MVDIIVNTKNKSSRVLTFAGFAAGEGPFKHGDVCNAIIIPPSGARAAGYLEGEVIGMPDSLGRSRVYVPAEKAHLFEI